jgi:hypothetical protein
MPHLISFAWFLLENQNINKVSGISFPDVCFFFFQPNKDVMWFSPWDQVCLESDSEETWSQFKWTVSRLSKLNYLYRGAGKKWRINISKVNAKPRVEIPVCRSHMLVCSYAYTKSIRSTLLPVSLRSFSSLNLIYILTCQPHCMSWNLPESHSPGFLSTPCGCCLMGTIAVSNFLCLWLIDQVFNLDHMDQCAFLYKSLIQ